MSRTRILLLVAILILLAGLAFWISRGQQPPPEPLPIQPVITAPTPHFPKIETIEGQPSHDTSLVSGKFPEQIQAYRVGTVVSYANFAAGLAQKLGFNIKPRKITLTGGELLVWEIGSRVFSFGGEPIQIGYTTPLVKDSTIIKDPAGLFDALARAFLKGNNLYPPAAGLSAPTIKYLAPRGNDPIQTTSNKATVIQLEYYLLIDGFPLISGYPDIPAFKFWYDANKNLVSFSGIYYPLIQPAGGLVKIISLEEAKTRLSSGQGQVVSAFSQVDKNRVETQYYSFSTTQLRSVVIAYYKIPKQELLSPVFVFYGRAVDKKTGKSIDTISLVSAQP